jgi:hypothetical protein
MKTEYHYQFYNSNALLLINKKGQIKVLYTPFRVLSKIATERIALGCWLYVEEVWSDSQDKLQFVIYGLPYPYQHFYLPIKF